MATAHSDDPQHLAAPIAPVACIVLAAGLGTRLRSNRPKVLHEAAGRSLLGHVLAGAEALQPERIIVVTGPDMPGVAEAARPHETCVQPQRLGTADAVKAARSALGTYGGTVLVLYGDSPLITSETLKRLVAVREGDAPPAVAVMGVELNRPGAYGRLVRDEAGDLARIVEASDASETERAITLCNSGIMAFDGRTLFERLDAIGNDNAKGEYYLTDMVALARASGERCAVVEGQPEECLGVNSRADLAAVEAAFQQRLRTAAMAGGATLQDPASTYFAVDTCLGRDVTIEPHVYFGLGVSVADGAVIRGFSHLEGVSVGAGARIGPFARLRPGTKIGQNAHIGNFVEAKNAAFDEGAKANHLSYIGDASIGAGANIGAGTITCNYDGFLKHRTEIGAGAFIGSNTALVAPVSIGDGANIAAGSVITDAVPEHALGVARGRQRTIEGWAEEYRAKLAARKAAQKTPSDKG